MNYVLLSITDLASKTKMNISDSISLGLSTTALGMGIVFAVLIILWLVLSLFGSAAKNSGKTKEITDESKPEEAENVPAPFVPDSTNDDSELVAAISAAIALYLDQPAGSFRVVSFKRVNTKQAWNNKQI